MLINPQNPIYCTFQCGMNCHLYETTKENDPEIKRKRCQEGNWKEEYKVEFNPDPVFCHGCQVEDKPKICAETVYRLETGDRKENGGMVAG